MGRRFISSAAYPHRKDAEGRPLCRWCGSLVAPPRKSWCGQACVDEFLIRSNAGTMRARMLERDKGVCAACGCDTEKMQRVIYHASGSYEKLTRGIIPVNSWCDWASHVVWRLFGDMGFKRGQTLWEADHIVEVCNGGETELGNMQTLCVPCHKRKTRKMHQDRARARRGLPPRPEPATQIQLMRT